MQNINVIERSKVRKSNYTFLPKGIQIEDLLPCLVSQLALLAELEECSSLWQQAEHAKSQFFLSKGQRSEKLTVHFCLRAFRLKT